VPQTAVEGEEDVEADVGLEVEVGGRRGGRYRSTVRVRGGG